MRRKNTIYLIISACLICSCILALYPIKTLTARDETGKIVYVKNISPFDVFVIRYVHSVARRPVDEFYELTDDGKIKVVRSEYDMTGAGLPHNPEEGQKMYLRDDGKYVLTDINLVIDSYDVRVSYDVADHVFSMKKDSFHLRTLAKPGRPLSFRQERMRIAQYLTNRFSYLQKQRSVDCGR